MGRKMYVLTRTVMINAPQGARNPELGSTVKQQPCPRFKNCKCSCTYIEKTIVHVFEV